jgi:integrase
LTTTRSFSPSWRTPSDFCWRGEAAHEADRIFHRKGQALGDFKRAWHAALEAAGFSYQEKLANGKLRTRYTRCFHDFRRTAARNLVRAGVREGVAMAVTGHKTRSVFDRYNISSTDDVREAIEAVSKRG